MATKKSKKSMAKPVKQEPTVSNKVFYVVIAVVAVMGFMAGSYQDEMYKSVARIFGVRVVTESIDTSSLQTTFRQLKANFDGELSNSKLIEGANRGLVEAAGDPHTVYMSAEEANKFDKDLNGNIGGGIGAELTVESDRPAIVRVLDDHPAKKAGLKAGDVITKVNSDDTLGWTAEKAANEIRGEIGSSVKLEVLRNGDSKEFSITRANVVNPSVDSEVKDGIGILKVSRFDGETARLSREVAEDFKRRKVAGVILDMRNNAGGYLTASQDVASLWLDEKVIVTERRDGKVVDELKSRKGPLLEGVPTVVLVNGRSASASEIVAGALQDHGVATIIGETTFGKGTVQKVIGLDRGAELKVTIASWFTPNGKNISEEGIHPDKKVDMTEADYEAGRDPQLDAALKELDI